MRLLAAVGTAILAAASAIADDKEELGKAAKKTGELKSYKFAAELTLDGLPNGASPPLPEVSGWFHHEQGSYAKVGEFVQVARKGDKVAVCGQDGTWRSAEEFLQNQGGGGGGQGRRRGNPRDILAQIKPPHEELKDFENKFTKISKNADKERYEDWDCEVYTGDLTEEAAKSFLPGGGMLDRLGQAKITGKATAWVNPDGRLVRYKLETDIRIDLGGNEFTITYGRDVKLSRLDDVQETLPTDAAEILNKPADKPAEEKKDIPTDKAEEKPAEKKD